LLIDLGGYGQGTQYDFIRVTNTTALAGTLAVSAINGFESQLTNGASFTVLTANSLVGSFANVTNGAHLLSTDGFFDFIVSYGAGNSNVVLGSVQAVDTDGDGMPNWWELAHGFATNDSSDAVLDTDSDGQNNLAEFLAGTDPRNAASVFQILS